ncbi:uncharacterized protein LOC142317802 [Lycorma delicatula]|uniref:uncharacterized protein LOC142317802 n=1 Tax=Lycorma delicatula TaxID=130591 RepID=UPI003F515020
MSSPRPADINTAEVQLTLKQIGKFHALSYAAKKENFSKFLAAVSKIEEKWDIERLHLWKYILRLCGERGVMPIINENQSVEILKEFLMNYDDPVNFYYSLVKPVEPEAVLCHGDFCRNNMLFSYDSDGKPVSVKFFDLQTPRYSSPAIDLSFFLLMNTSKEMRENCWDDFLNAYRESVKSVLPDTEVPEVDFGRVGVYGYLHCSFFLPIMSAENRNTPPIEELLKLTPYERGVIMSKTGGPKETQYLVDIVKFLLKKNYIRATYY